jgi:hypothetical protein
MLGKVGTAEIGNMVMSYIPKGRMIKYRIAILVV